MNTPRKAIFTCRSCACTFLAGCALVVGIAQQDRRGVRHEPAPATTLAVMPMVATAIIK